MVHSLDFDV